MIRLFDCNASLGAKPLHQEHVPYTTEQLLSRMKELKIERALVRHNASVDADLRFGNNKALEESGKHPELLPVWCIVAAGADEIGKPADFVSNMLSAGVCAATMFPRQHHFSFADWCLGDVLSALEDARVPLLVDHSQVSLDELAAALPGYPQLPLICTGMGYRENRRIYPLMDMCPNLHMDISAPYSVHFGIEDICRRFGAERLLFGTGWPTPEPGTAISMLMYSSISDEEKQLIG
ncbi:MAG: amidohydrolase family protein, partial [Phycisphaerae bacterium]|nr:amidohydrolase family protein [Phycisphaerae bacterium]